MIIKTENYKFWTPIDYSTSPRHNQPRWDWNADIVYNEIWIKSPSNNRSIFEVEKGFNLNRPWSKYSDQPNRRTTSNYRTSLVIYRVRKWNLHPLYYIAI